MKIEKSKLCVLFISLLFISSCRINVQNPTGGTVYLTGDMQGSCPAGKSCYLDVPPGRKYELTFEAIPDTGWRFIGWQHGPAFLCGNQKGPCNISISKQFADADVEVQLVPVYRAKANQGIENYIMVTLEYTGELGEDFIDIGDTSVLTSTNGIFDQTFRSNMNGDTYGFDTDVLYPHDLLIFIETDYHAIVIYEWPRPEYPPGQIVARNARLFPPTDIEDRPRDDIGELQGAGFIAIWSKASGEAHIPTIDYCEPSPPGYVVNYNANINQTRLRANDTYFVSFGGSWFYPFGEHTWDAIPKGSGEPTHLPRVNIYQVEGRLPRLSQAAYDKLVDQYFNLLPWSDAGTECLGDNNLPPPEPPIVAPPVEPNPETEVVIMNCPNDPGPTEYRCGFEREFHSNGEVWFESTTCRRVANDTGRRYIGTRKMYFPDHPNQVQRIEEHDDCGTSTKTTWFSWDSTSNSTFKRWEILSPQGCRIEERTWDSSGALTEYCTYEPPYTQNGIRFCGDLISCN